MSSTGRLKVAGAFNKTGGIFTHNSGRVILASIIDKPFASNGATFYDLIVNDGLVAYLPMDENTGTTVNDRAGYGNNGTLVNGPTWVSGGNVPTFKFDNISGVNFDGVNDYATLPTSNLPNLSGPITVAFWMYYTSVPAASKDVIALVSASGRLQIGFFGSAGIGAWNNGSTNRVTAASTPASGWHHVAYTYNGTTHSIYIDGNSATTSTNAASTGVPTSAFLGTYNGAAELFAGRIDDLRIYSRVLSSTACSPRPRSASWAGGSFPPPAWPRRR